MGKKKDKPKDKKKSLAAVDERPGRKDLMRHIERLQAENESLRARLERIAEIAAEEESTAGGDDADAPLALLLPASETA